GGRLPPKLGGSLQSPRLAFRRFLDRATPTTAARCGRDSRRTGTSCHRYLGQYCPTYGPIARQADRTVLLPPSVLVGPRSRRASRQCCPLETCPSVCPPHAETCHGIRGVRQSF